MVLLLDPVGHFDVWRANEPTDLPPIGRWAQRLGEYPVNYGYFLRDPRARITQAGIEVLAAFNPNARITQFGLELIVALFPPGTQLTGNPPAPRPRAVDYTFLLASNIGQLALVQPPNPGDTTAVSTALPPKAPARAIDYSWFNPLLPQLAGQDALLPDHSTNATALSTPAVPRSRDYTYTASYFQGLVGQDAMLVGDQLSGNAPPGVARASTLSDPGTNALIYLTAPLPPNPRFAGGQSTDLTALSTPPAARARDYTWLHSLPIHLIGQDRFNPGVQVFDLPPRGSLRARDYTWIYSLPAQFPPQAPALPPGGQLTSIAPEAPHRMRADYPHVARAALPLLLTPSAATEQFQAVLII